MEKRGRKSANELETPKVVSLEKKPPKPPKELTAEQTLVWRSVVDSLPSDWIKPEHRALLIQYCRHVVAASRVDGFIRKIEAENSFGLEDYDRLLKMQEREGRAVLAISRSLRLTHQSQKDPATAHRDMRDGMRLPPWSNQHE